MIAFYRSFYDRLTAGLWNCAFFSDFARGLMEVAMFLKAGLRTNHKET